MRRKMLLSTMVVVVVCVLLLVSTVPALAYSGQELPVTSVAGTGSISWVPVPLEPNNYPPPGSISPPWGGY
jgi:hypothetical protein